MKREGLSAAGLVAESKAHRAKQEQYDDDLLWYIDRIRDTHDLYHVLTGYGRDALGEASLLGYTHSQHKGRGISFIAYMGAREISKFAPRDMDIHAVVAEGRRHGKVAKRIIEQDIVELLREPIDEARARLNIGKPQLYRDTARRLQEFNSDEPILATA